MPDRSTFLAALNTGGAPGNAVEHDAGPLGAVLLRPIALGARMRVTALAREGRTDEANALLLVESLVDGQGLRLLADADARAILDSIPDAGAQEALNGLLDRCCEVSRLTAQEPDGPNA